MSPETVRGIAVLAVIGVVIFIFMQLKEKKNKSLAESGEDKARLKSVADRLFAGIEDCHPLYGHYEDVQHYGRSTRTTYYRYLLAHDSQRLWVAPLDFQQGSILPQGRAMEKLTDETWEYLAGGDDTTSLVPFDGRVKLLSKEEPGLVSYYENAMEELGYTQSELEEMGPVMLLIPRAYDAIRVFCAIGAAFLVVSILLAVRTFRPARTRKGGAPEVPWES